MICCQYSLYLWLLISFVFCRFISLPCDFFIFWVFIFVWILFFVFLRLVSLFRFCIYKICKIYLLKNHQLLCGCDVYHNIFFIVKKWAPILAFYINFSILHCSLNFSVASIIIPDLIHFWLFAYLHGLKLLKLIFMLSPQKAQTYSHKFFSFSSNLNKHVKTLKLEQCMLDTYQ